jgi:hypothetical protein
MVPAPFRGNFHVSRILETSNEIEYWLILDQGFRVGDKPFEPTDQQSLCDVVPW